MEGVNFTEALWRTSRAEIRHELKARIGKLLFKDEGLYRVLNDDDPAIEKAIQVLRKGDPLVSAKQ